MRDTSIAILAPWLTELSLPQLQEGFLHLGQHWEAGDSGRSEQECGTRAEARTLQMEEPRAHFSVDISKTNHSCLCFLTSKASPSYSSKQELVEVSSCWLSAGTEGTRCQGSLQKPFALGALDVAPQ